jgi:hypothetical protein
VPIADDDVDDDDDGGDGDRATIARDLLVYERKG